MHSSEQEAPQETEAAAATPIRKFSETPAGYRWEGIPLKEYKPEGTHFQNITRQVLFGEAEDLPTQLRYFEIAPGGHSTLERHRHVHAVLILRGEGRALVGEDVHAVAPFDLVYVPPMTWHQFRAAEDAPLGFLCLVACDRDRPIRPGEEDLRGLKTHPVIGGFIRV